MTTPVDPDRASGAAPLTEEEERACRSLVERVRREVPAQLHQVSLFGSKARGEARPDSDLDLLLVFRSLPPDREPQAGQAEAIAEEVARGTGIPVTVWSVSLIDLERGRRTPMLVDALADSLPLWCENGALPSVPFTPEDAIACTGALLDRVAEGEMEVAASLRAGARREAIRRVRDDLVRMCVALHLLEGQTRPRRAEAAEGVLEREGEWLPRSVREALRWAAASYGPAGRDDEAPVVAPPGLTRTAEAVGVLRTLVAERRARLRAGGGTGPPVSGYSEVGTRIARRHGPRAAGTT